MLLESIYEQDFHEGSYVFRLKRSLDNAMDALWKETMRIGGGWILEVDLRKYLRYIGSLPSPGPRQPQDM